MATSKKATRMKNTRNTKNINQLIYVGPTLSEGRLSFSTVFYDGIPAYLQEIIKDHPWFRQLFVPVSELELAHKATQEKGSYLNILFNKAKKEV